MQLWTHIVNNEVGMDGIYKILTVVSQLVRLYSFLIWIMLICSWIKNPSLQSNILYKKLCRITEPFLKLFSRLKTGRFDWSFLFALMSLNIVRTVLETAVYYKKFTFFLVVAAVLQNLFYYIFKYILLILIIMLAVRWVMTASGSQSVWIQILDRNLNAPVSIVFRIFFTGKNPTEQKLVAVSFFFYGCIYFILKYSIQYFSNFLISL